MNTSKFYVQVLSAEEFYNLYDEPTDNFKELVKQDSAYFHPASDLYEDTRKDKRAYHIVTFARDTHTAVSHVGIQVFPTIIYIFHIFTLEPYRRQGLVKHTLNTLQQQQNIKLGLRVDSVNTEAITLYEQLGFTQGNTGIQTTEDDTDIEYVWTPDIE